MKKRNAFTLIELIATIAILAVVSIVATITYSKIRKDVLEHQYLNLKSLIETAAIKYSSKNGYTSFFVKDLIDDGLVEPDDESDVYDPRDDKSLNCHIVTISIEKNGLLSAAMSDESYTQDGTCKVSSLDVYEANLRMNAKIEGTDVTYPVNSLNTGTSAPYIFEGWTRFNLDITADPSSIPESIDNAKYVWNRNNDVTTIEPNRKITTNEYGVYNNYYYLDMYTESGSRYQAKLLYKFDNEKPTIYRDSNNKDRIKFVDAADNDRWAKSKNVFIYASDKNGSGLSRIYIGREKCTKLLDDPNFGRPAIPGIIQVYEVKIETGRDVNEEYNVCIVDKAGNIAQSKTKIKWVDITKPRCDHIDPDLGSVDEPINMANWVRPDRTIKAYCEDDHYITEDGVERHLYGSGCTQDHFDKTYSPTTINGSTVIRDNVGWEETCNYRVLVDKTPPICGWSEGESTVWQQEDRTIYQHYTDVHSGPLEDTVNTKTFTTTTKVGDHVVTDNVGNTQTCHPNVYVDKTPPYISYAQYGSGTRFYESSCPGSISYTWKDDESGFKSGTLSTYYGGSLKVSGMSTGASFKARLWTNSSKSNICSIGSYKFEMKGTDNVGNTSSTKTYNYSVIEDPPPPPPPLEQTTNPPGCSDRFTSRERDPQFCSSTGYYMKIYEDECRSEGYGCKSNEEIGTIKVTATGDTKNMAIQAAKNKLRKATVTDIIGTGVGHYMYSGGDQGQMYIRYNCTGGSSVSCSYSSSMKPVAYIFSESNCTETMKCSADDGCAVSCTVTKKRCNTFKNGIEYWPGTNSAYQFYCCKNKSADPYGHCQAV